MSPTDLSDSLRGLNLPAGPDLLVGVETADDAAVYRLTPEIAVISTIDYITPPVDDPIWFGRIAAANSLSDVWAMGGEPVMALNVVNFPAGDFDIGILREILRGGAEKVAEAGASLGGGHSVDDPEPKYGLAVTGVVHPGKILANRGALPGDALVLTKPIGTGVIFNANRAGKFPRDLLDATLPVVAALNGPAMRAALKHPVHAITDITGFAVTGHVLEMAEASGVRAVLSFRSLPLFEGAVGMYAAGETTGSNEGNRRLCGARLTIGASLRREEEEILFDPQTSGGLLVALPAGDADALVSDLRGAGAELAAVVGRIEEGSGLLIEA